MSKVQIIVPVINLWDKYTKAAIESIKTKHEYRVLLIDNASTDNTSVEAGKLVSSTFAHQRNEERWAFSKSANFGIKDAFERGYDYAFVINNDVLLHPEAIDRLVERFEKAKNNLVLDKSVDLQGEEPTATACYSETNVLAMVTSMDVRGECAAPTDILTKDLKEKESVPEAEHPCFSAFMVNRLCWDKIGPMDEEFKPAYYEDNDYHYRINLAGMKAIVLPTSLFYHYASKTQTEALDKPATSHEQFRANQFYYVKKWGGMPGKENYKSAFNK
jgi:GT2 family glycosyltransferase